MPPNHELINIEKGSFRILFSSAIVHLIRFNGLAMAVTSQSSSETLFLYLDSIDLDESNFMKTCDLVERGLNEFRTLIKVSKKERLFVKYILSGSSVNQLDILFSQFGLESKGKLIDKSRWFEVYYYAQIKKLRISKTSVQIPGDEKKDAVKVLIVDDSSTIRKILRNLIHSDPRFYVVAEASMPSQVEQLIGEHKPDVVTLDIKMPEMSGVELLKIIQPKFKIPTIMVTALNIDESTQVLEALESGAIDYIQKPSLKDIEVLGPELREKLLAAATAQVDRQASHNRPAVRSRTLKRENNDFRLGSRGIIVFGSSTGGTEALKKVLVPFGSEVPPIIVAQHIPEYFSKAFANRLDQLCRFTVKEAQHNEIVKANTCYIAPGGKHLRVLEKKSGYILDITDADIGCQFRPSVDYLFDSVANLSSPSIGIIMTGMGGDGAKGLLKMKEAGHLTLSQSQETCVVYGMPKVAENLGAVQRVVHLGDMFEEISLELKNYQKAG